MEDRSQRLEILRFITCGSVDDGKSTLIGRLLVDSKAVLADQWQAIEATSQRRGFQQTDLSLLTDGLQSEREQGITIDVAYRYFSTPKRRFIIADTPGHAQYTRNMVTGASTADLAILLLDVKKGVMEQTRRHAHIVRLLGIRRVVVAVNKMDLVDYREADFLRVTEAFETFAEPLGFREIDLLPISAMNGDGVVYPGGHMNWFQGPTLMDILEHTPLDEIALEAPFRYPVQSVNRLSPVGAEERRGALGRVESGQIGVGDAVVVLPAGRPSRIASIETWEGSLAQARAGQSVTLTLEDQIDFARGDMIASVTQPPRLEKTFEALLCWFSTMPFDPARRLILQHTTRSTPVKVDRLLERLDVRTSQVEKQPAGAAMNDLVRVALRTQHPLALDTYEANRACGSFIVMDAVTHDTVAAGMIC